MHSYFCKSAPDHMVVVIPLITVTCAELTVNYSSHNYWFFNLFGLVANSTKLWYLRSCVKLTLILNKYLVVTWSYQVYVWCYRLFVKCTLCNFCKITTAHYNSGIFEVNFAQLNHISVLGLICIIHTDIYTCNWRVINNK